jgi:hypothetical protein
MSRTPDLARITWRKSSHSGSTTAQSDCVELARLAGTVGVRDSGAPEAGHLVVSLEVFARLVAQVKCDEPDA